MSRCLVSAAYLPDLGHEGRFFFFVLICVSYHKCVAFVIRKTTNSIIVQKRLCSNSGTEGPNVWGGLSAARNVALGIPEEAPA